jgi:hypothetical protein
MIWELRQTRLGEAWFAKWGDTQFRIALGAADWYQLSCRVGDDRMSDVGVFSSLEDAKYAASLIKDRKHLDVRGLDE